jgi:hypothetical protein
LVNNFQPLKQYDVEIARLHDFKRGSGLPVKVPVIDMVEIGSGGGSLAEELTIVVLSEMGRFPLLNQVGGKDHWTYTSAMLIGSGIQGGQAVGEYDADCRGGKIDLVTGQPDEQGISLVGAHLGATVLQLADIDPAEHLVGFEPISAILT